MLRLVSQVVLIMYNFINANDIDNYWQQNVDYKMKVSLIDSIRQLTGTSIIKYTNNSPDSLDRIYMHLYPNAFQNNSVKYREYLDSYGRKSRAKDIRESLNSFISKIEIHNLSISLPQEGLSWIHKKSILNSFDIEDTILEINLSHKIGPGETSRIDLSWTHHVGEMVERAGFHKGQYNMAQWYPKIAVYDHNGWNADFFHAEGEFYGEFGTFEVELTMPKAFVVAATGVVAGGDPGWSDVQVDTSLDFSIWRDIFDSTFTAPSSNESRNVTFLANNVHDFAWVASKNFFYEGGKSKDLETDIHILYDRDRGSNWSKVVLDRSVEVLDWLEKKIGEYPYPQISTVDRVKNGGMEYPMLVMNGRDDESLIAHEFGHVYFYGILANNEIDEAWLDEGFTTFQTTQYMAEKYGNHGFDPDLFDGYDKYPKNRMPKQSELSSDQWSAIRFQISGNDENISRPSHLFKSTRSYSQNAYTKPSLMLFGLKYILEDSLFNEVIKQYYEKWKFKHTNEERFISVVEDVVGDEMGWFFEPWLHTTRKLDYSIKSYKKSIQKDNSWKVFLEIENKGSRFLPMKIQTILEDGSKSERWWLNHPWRYMDTLSYHVPKKPLKVSLDPNVETLDLDYRNNTTRMGKKFLFNWPDTYYNPRDEFVYKWNPNFYYENLKNDFSPGIFLVRQYGPYEKSTLNLNYSHSLKRVYWDFSTERLPVHFFNRTKFKIWSMNKPGIFDYGAEINKKWNFAYGRTPTQNFSMGFYFQPKYTPSRKRYIDIDTSEKLGVGYLKVAGSVGMFKIKLDLFSSLGSFSYWNFNKAILQGNVNFSKKSLLNKRDFFKIIPSFNILFKNRFFVGKVWGNAPNRELFSIEGNEEYDFLKKRYLIDGFYGNSNLNEHYYLPGGGNLRGFINSDISKANELLSMTNELIIDRIGSDRNFIPKLKIFIDSGFFWNDQMVNNHFFLADAGMGFFFKYSLMGKDLCILTDFPFIIYDETLKIDKQNWTFSFQRSF